MRLLLAFFAMFFLTPTVRAQERVRNVRVRVIDSSQLEIRYDLINTRPGDSIYFDVRSRLRGSLRILPEFVQGDVGHQITAGSERRILWDALANGYSLNEEIQAIVRVRAGLPREPSAPADQPVAVRPAPKPTKPGTTTPKSTTVPGKTSPTESVAITEPSRPKPTKPIEPPVEKPKPVTATDNQPQSRPAPPVTQPPVQTAPPADPPTVTEPAPAQTDAPEIVQRRYNGPAWALVSAVAPGIGNIFVQRPRPKVGLRPLLTVGSYGLAVYGILQKQKANDVFAVYEQQKNAATAEPFYVTANQHNHRYYAATRAAITVAAADVILTFFKGLRNSQLRKEGLGIQSVTVRPGIQSGQPTAVVRYSF